MSACGMCLVYVCVDVHVGILLCVTVGVTVGVCLRVCVLLTCVQLYVWAYSCV